jgi:hypothetical protein
MGNALNNGLTDQISVDHRGVFLHQGLSLFPPASTLRKDVALYIRRHEKYFEDVFLSGSHFETRKGLLEGDLLEVLQELEV